MTEGEVETLTIDVPLAEVFRPLTGSARYKAAYGGRGSGKSHAFATFAVLRTAFKAERILCLREYQKSLAMSVKSLIERKIEELGLEEYFDVQDKRIRSRAGGLIIFEGLQGHNSDSLKSFENFHVSWFEEAHSASQRSLDILIPTMRNEDSELWFTWNPDAPDCPIEFLRNDPPDGAVVLKANWRDNPWFPEVLKKEMEYTRQRDPDKYQHIWEGGFRQSSNARVFRNWRVEEFDAEEIDGLGGPYGGADWGFASDPTVLVRAWVDDVGRKVYVDYEAWKIGCRIVDTPKLFKQVPGAIGLNIRADSARPETIDHMRGAGFYIRPARKGAGSVEEGIEFLKAYDIVVHPRCRHVIDELTHYSWEMDRLTGEPKNTLADKHNHTIDALRYALENVRRSVHEFW